MKNSNLKLHAISLSLLAKRFCLLFVLFLSGLAVSAQSETHNFITYDTVYKDGSFSWNIRISRPANMFTANHPDAASRPAIINMNGQGEVGTNSNVTAVYGPHYWLNNGWDGSVKLGNGTHYPILITVACRQYNGQNWVNPRGPQIHNLVTYLLNTYHIKRNAVHFSGLSMGAFSWGKYLTYEASPGARTGMRNMTSLVCLQGASNETFAPYNAWTLGWDAFGIWARDFGGKFFGLEGTSDTRQVWRISENMNAKVSGSAYFSYENIGGGGHCCWNTMYNPSSKNWKNQNGDLGSNIVWNTQHHNTMGTYRNGWNLFEWQLRQGDTTLVGSGNPPPANIPPTVNAGADQTLTLPVNSVQLKAVATDPDGTIASYSWTKVSGPATFNLSNSGIPNPVLSTLVAGTYTFRVLVTDNSGATATDNINVVVNQVIITAGPTNSSEIKVNLYGGSNAYNNSEWNNWNIGNGGRTNVTSQTLKYTDGTSSSSTAVLSQSTSIADNTTSYSGTMAPKEVLRYTSYSTMIRTLTIKGLSANRTYSVQLFSSRKTGSTQRTNFSCGNKSAVVDAKNNQSNIAVLSGLAPNAQGEIEISITRLNTYTYLNGFIIAEDGSAGATAKSMVSDTVSTVASNNSSIDLYPNPVENQLVLKLKNDLTGKMKISILNMAGIVVKTMQVDKTQKISQVYLTMEGLNAGNYIIRMEIGNWNESKIISKL